MSGFILFAQPWWVNLLVFVPVALFFYFWKNKLSITNAQLFIAGLFGAAFGFIEAAVVVYLRAASGFLPGYEGSLADVVRQASDEYLQIQAASGLPQSLLTVEVLRELATIVLLVTFALLCARAWQERIAFFFWAFALWDIFYYVGLWATVRWPSSLFTSDVLFLTPAPWFAQVWFPCLVSVLVIIAIVVNRKDTG